MPSHSGSSESAVKGPGPVHERTVVTSPNAVTVYDWSKESTPCCCKPLSFVHQVIWTATIGSFLFGFNLSLLNTCLNHISWEFEWCNFRDGTDSVTDCTTHTVFSAFMSTAVFIGAAVGSMSGGLFLSYGRRGMYIMSMIVFAVGILCSVCAGTFPSLLLARLIVGVAVGLVSFVSPTYITEMAPTAKRGQYGVYHQLLIGIGVFMGVVVGLPLAYAVELPEMSGPGVEEIPGFGKVWWRVMLGMGIVPVIIATVLFAFHFRFETPLHYIEADHYEDARQLLKKIYNKDDVESELHEIVSRREEALRLKAEGLSFGVAMKRPDYRFVILFGCVVSAFQQLSGVNVFVANSNALYIDAGLPASHATTASVIQSLFGFLVTFPAIYLIERVGRKSLFLYGTIGQFLCCLPATITFWVVKDEDSPARIWLAIVGAVGTIIFFGIGYGPILWVWLFEIYPTEIKGVASGLATALNWVAGIAMVFVVSYMKNDVAYLLFTIMLALALVIIIFGIKETRGRELGDSPYIQSKMREQEATPQP